MANYTDHFEYEDMNLGVRIVDDKPALRQLFKTFENKDPEASKHYFNATRYHGNKDGGTLEWTCKIEHTSDFMGMPTTGTNTQVRGMTIHKFKAEKIILERSLWDTASLLRQVGMPAPIELEF